jgi:hypothetical protein
VGPKNSKLLSPKRKASSGYVLEQGGGDDAMSSIRTLLVVRAVQQGRLTENCLKTSVTRKLFYECLDDDCACQECGAC